MANRKILKRKCYAVLITLASPLCVSSGNNENTDKDVLRSADGEIFLPGSSIAGAWREFLGQKKNDDGILGFSEDEKGRMSPITISDLFLYKKHEKQSEKDDSTNNGKNVQEDEKQTKKVRPTVSVRDGVKLDEDKDVINKFDMEIVETGAEGILYFSCIEREKDPWDYDTAISDILKGMQTAEIRFGASKNRGMGRIRIKEVHESTFTKENVAEWIEFSHFRKDPEKYQTHESYEKWAQSNASNRVSKYLTIKVPLKLRGGISIRKYSTKPLQADYEHITANGEPVIPGASWNGAIRSDVRSILNDLGCRKTEQYLRTWFGCIEDDLDGGSSGSKRTLQPEEDGASKEPPAFTDALDSKDEDLYEAASVQEEVHQSRIVIGESILRGAVPVPMIRNKINRIDASTVDGALYSDISYYGGETDLCLMIRKDEGAEYKALIGVLDIVIKDIQEGYLPVGGLVSVGRGVFQPGDRPVEYSEPVSRDVCMSKLYSLL